MISAEMVTGFCGDFCGDFCVGVLWLPVLFGDIDVGVMETFDAAAVAAAAAAAVAATGVIC